MGNFRMKALFPVILLLATLLSACATDSPPRPTYTQQVASIPPPVSDNDRQRKCGWLRAEIARQQNIAMVGSTQLQGLYATALQVSARNNIAVLESRASDFGCYTAFSPRTAPSNIESCVATCKANTSKSPEQCFDACNH